MALEISSDAAFFVDENGLIFWCITTQYHRGITVNVESVFFIKLGKILWEMF